VIRRHRLDVGEGAAWATAPLEAEGLPDDLAVTVELRFLIVTLAAVMRNQPRASPLVPVFVVADGGSGRAALIVTLLTVTILGCGSTYTSRT
jgi:hypothetical protein